MKKIIKILLNKRSITLAFMWLLFISNAQAKPFDVLSASPIGSWQTRELIETNRKGKQTGTKIKTSMIGKEQRDGKLHYWIEMEIDSFKIRKSGKRKPTGKTSVIKSLIPESIFNDDPENVFGNLRAFGTETIIQNGNEKPMKISTTNGLIAGAMKMAKVEIKHDYTELGNETVSVKAGKFKASKINGVGNVSTKILFKKINVESDSTVWMSTKVPFGIVKLKGITITNGKETTQSGELLEYGFSGAKSAITQTPQEMPKIPNIFGG